MRAAPVELGSAGSKSGPSIFREPQEVVGVEDALEKVRFHHVFHRETSSMSASISRHIGL